MAYSEYNLANLNSRIQQIKMLIKRDNSTMKVVFKNIFIRVHNNGTTFEVFMLEWKLKLERVGQ